MIEIRDLSYAYESDGPRIFDALNLEIPAGSRSLLVGANGVGKSTLLRLIAGRHLVRRDAIRIGGKSPFHDASLGAEIAFIDDDFGIDLDLRVAELLAFRSERVVPELERDLLEILGVDPAWRMHRVSLGQKRRVQLLLELRKRAQIVLLDEVTTHLDLLVRARFLTWLKECSLGQQMTVVYATHIFDDLWKSHVDPWPTHLIFLSAQGAHRVLSVATIEKLRNAAKEGLPSPLLTLCENWMSEDALAQ